MIYDIDELEAIADNILSLLPERMYGALSKANRTGELYDMLRLLDMLDVIEQPEELETSIRGKIVVIGDSAVKEEKLRSIASKLRLDPARFEYNLGYDAVKRFEFSKLRYNSSYRVVLVGPMPHSTKGKGEDTSAITAMENNKDIYPKVVRLISGSELKITNNSFKEALAGLICEGYIV